MREPTPTEAELKRFASGDKSLVTPRIIEAVKVFEVDDDGKETKAIAFFEDKDLAGAKVAEDKSGHRKSTPVFVLKDTVSGISLGYVLSTEPVVFADEERERKRLTEMAMELVPEPMRYLLIKR